MTEARLLALLVALWGAAIVSGTAAGVIAHAQGYTCHAR